jgi:glycerol-3-phosphate dehydrogenase
MKLRESNLQRLQAETLDTLIIGGGINGAISAAALSAQGARVGLVDRKDFAAHTSQESSNLIWGGIKYMETGEFALVRKLCMSRNELLDAYPSSVHEVRFYTTLERGFRWPRSALYAGAWLYWAIGSGFTAKPRLLSVADINREEPTIRTDSSVGGFEYSDAYLVDNDARFVFGFIRSALDNGAMVANYTAAGISQRDSTGVWRTDVTDMISGRKHSLRSRTIINAAGPFVDQQNATNAIATEHQHVFSKGIHLIVPRLTRERRVLTFFADDGRLFFIIPMGVMSCIGTTDTRVSTPDATITDDDRNFVLSNINKRLKLTTPLTRADVVAERCGVRPLVIRKNRGSDATQDWTKLSRKHAIDFDPSGYLSIYGGKLTDCLNIGREIADILKNHGLQLPHRTAKWFGEPLQFYEEFKHRAHLLGLDQMTAPESSERLSSRLWRRYGLRALNMLESIRQDPRMAEVLIKGTEYIRCELYEAAENEMVTKLEDFLRRRSKIALIASTERIRRAAGLQEACQILFGAAAESKLDEYFDQHPIARAASV